MDRRLLLAPFSAHDVTERLLRAAVQLVPGPDFRGILYLTPSPRKLRDTQHRFVGLCGHSGFLPPTFATPGQLSRSLHDAHAGTARLPAELRPLLVRRLLAADGPRPTLGYARAVGDFIRDIKTWVPERSGLRALFEEELAGFERPLKRALESLDLLDRYDRELAAHDRVDDEDIWLSAARHAAAAKPGVLVLDGFAAPSPLEQALLRALVDAAGTTLTACFAGDEQDPDYRLAARFREFIEGIGGFSAATVEPGPLPGPGGLYRFTDPEREIEGIARHLRSRESLDDTVVAMPDLAASAPMVARVFEQFGVPATLYPEGSLDTAGPVADVLELLRALDSDFERVPTTAALSSPWLPGLLRLPGDDGAGPRNRAAAALNQLSRRAGIIKGRTDWYHIAVRLESAEGEPDEPMAAFIADVQARVRQALGLAARILEPADTLGRQAARLKQFLEAVDFARDVEDVAEDRGALYDLLDALAGFDAEFGPASEPRSGFIRTLEYLTGLKPRNADPAPAGVLVVGLDETIGLHPRRLLCPALTETNLPGSYRSDPILPDRLLRRLKMPDMDWHRDWQRFHLRRTIESARDEAFLSFHDSRDGKPVLPTPFLELDIRSLPEPEVLYAPFEEQLAAGRRRGTVFTELTRSVSFARDRAVLDALGRQFGPERAISVTGVEAFQRCPFKFYLERVLGLDSPPEPQYEIDAAQWGSVIHHCLHLLYAKGTVPVAKLTAHARAALDQALRDFGLPLFWAETTRRVFDNLLPAFVEAEKGLRAEGYAPSRTEHGVRGKVADDIAIRGRFDRLDEGPDALRVLDYKTGSASISAKAVLEDRTHVQLPLYAHLVGQETGKRVDNAGVYSTREGRVRWLADGKHPLADLVAAALETTVAAVRAIRQGEFPARPPDERSCRDCDYAYLCGPLPAEDR